MNHDEGFRTPAEKSREIKVRKIYVAMAEYAAQRIVQDAWDALVGGKTAWPYAGINKSSYQKIANRALTK